MKKKVLFFLFFAVLTGVLFGQTDVKKNYTKPWFQGNIKVADTLGVDTLLSTNGKIVDIDSIATVGDIPATPSLSSVLTAGNTTSDGQTFNSLNGDVQLNLRDGGNDVFDLTNDNGAFGKAWFYGDGTTAQYGFGGSYLSLASATGIEISSTLGALNYTSISNDKFSVTGTAFLGVDMSPVKIVDNTLAKTIGGGAINKGISINNTGSVTFNAAVKNSIALGYSGIVKTNNTVYLNQFAYSDGAFETILNHATSTANNTITFQDGSGTVPFLTDTSNLGNTDVSLTGGRIITMGANDLTFSRSTGNIGFGVTPTQAQLEVLGATENTTVMITANGNTSVSIPLLIENLAGDEILRVLGQGKIIFNNNLIVQADVQMKGDNESNLFYLNAGTDNIGMGTSAPDAAALLEMSSTTMGLLTPRMNTTQRNAITSVPEGLMIYNNQTSRFEYHNGSNWDGIHLARFYATQGFADSSVTLTMTQNIYTQITNPANTLFTTGVVEGAGITVIGDSMRVNVDGNYEIEWDCSYSGSNTDEYHIAVFIDDVEQNGKGESQRDMSSSNIGSASSHTILALSATEFITLRIRNVNNNNDATVVAGNITVKKLGFGIVQIVLLLLSIKGIRKEENYYKKAA